MTLINDHDITIAAKTIYGEARGEPLEGKYAVAHVIKNRAALADNHPHFGDGSPASACLAKWQFSCWNDPTALQSIRDDDVKLDLFKTIARHVLGGGHKDNTNGATYYFANWMKEPPEWAKGHSPCAVIGKHLFFRGIK